MPQHEAEATWTGTLKNGEGRMATGSGAFEGPYSFTSRFQENAGTNPEELIGAAHAGCFAMAFAKTLEEADYTPQRIDAKATVTLEQADGAPTITKILLETEAAVPGIDDAQFQKLAEDAKQNCVVSRALRPVSIDLRAALAR
jgi:osmotically inducible protein OsmC